MSTNLKKIFGRIVFYVVSLLILAACQQISTTTILDSPNTTEISDTVAIPIGDISPDVMSNLHEARAENQLITTATGPNLLSNPSFENGANSWTACDAASTLSSSNTSISGLALSVSNGCMYQDVVVQPAKTYTLSCKARLSNTSGWSGTGFGISNSNFSAIAEAPESQITGTSWSTYTSTFTTPANSNYASIWFYTDGTILIDDCSFTEELANGPNPTPSQNLLPNGSFDSQSNWFNCSNASAYSISGGNLNTNSTACIYQTIEAEVGGNYQLTCNSKTNTGVYSSITLSMLNSSWTAIATDTKAITPSSLQTINLTNVAPTNTKYVAITLYSEGVSQHQNCELTLAGITQPPVATLSNPVPTPDGSLFPYSASHPTDNEATLAANSNLLVNPSFTTQSGWSNCATPSASMSGGDLNIKPGVCFFQEVLAQVGATYSLTCRGSMALPIYSVFTLNMLDANYQSLATESQTIHTSNRQWRLDLQAPANTKFVTVGFYTESDANYDYCYLTKATPPQLVPEQIYAPVKPLEVLLPIYIDPAQDITPWNQVIASSQNVPTTVVVNPVLGGIEGCQEATFASTLNSLQSNSVDTIGYIPTGYTATPIATVKANIDRYADCPGLDGVFFDEIKVATQAQANYYQEICSYAQTVFGNGKFVVNAGTNIEIPITNQFCNIALIFEFYQQNWLDFAVFGYQGASTDPATSIMVHTNNGIDVMKDSVDLAYSRKIDYIFVTDDTVPNPWTTLGSYWTEFTNYLAQKNAQF